MSVFKERKLNMMSAEVLEKIPLLETQEDYRKLAESGYGLYGGHVKNYVVQRDVLRDVSRVSADFAMMNGNRSELLTELETVGGLVLDSLFNSPSGISVCERNPREEYVRLAELVYGARKKDESLFVVAPVCPDYLPGKQYKLGDGVGFVAGKLLNKLSVMRDFFGGRGVDLRVQIHMADVEAYDPLILGASGETSESFFLKTQRSIDAINKEAVKRGLAGVEVVSMNKVFADCGIDYKQMQTDSAVKIKAESSKKVRKVRESLMSERIKRGDFSGINGENLLDMVSMELGGYAAYGELVDGKAVIVSADAMSSVPAYNFFRNDRDFNPVIQIK